MRAAHKDKPSNMNPDFRKKMKPVSESDSSNVGINSSNVLHQSFLYRGYRIRSTEDEALTRRFLDSILRKSYEVQRVFKDSKSTYAAQLKIEDESLVLKIPRSRLRRKWEKLLTLVRDSESFRTFENLKMMLQLGFKAPVPLLAGEKRRKGFVVDSFCCYRFEEGREAGPSDAQAVVEELLRLHDKGYLRSDAKPANFLMTDEGVTFIDFRLKRPVIFPRLKLLMELAHFVQVYPESLKFVPDEIQNSNLFALAGWFEQKTVGIKQARRRLKRVFQSK